MGKSTLRKALAVFMAVAVMMAFTVTGAFAASSPQKGEEQKSEKVIKPVGEYKVSSEGTAALAKVKASEAKTIKTKTIFEKIKHNGKYYKVNKVAAKAFSKCKKLKTLKIKWKTMKGKSFSAKAFKGLKKSQIKKIKVGTVIITLLFLATFFLSK